MQESEQQPTNQENIPASRPELGTVSSPRWGTSTKRLVVTILVVLALLALYRVRALVVPLIMSFIVAYLVLPMVDFLHRRTRLSRNLSITIVYLLIAAILIAIPVGTIPQLIAQGNALVNNAPTYVEQLGDLLSEPLVLGGYTIPLDDLPLEEAYASLSNNILDIVGTIGPQGFSLFGGLASATLSTLAWILIVLVVSFYFVKDYRLIWGSLVAFAPESYHSDLQRLGTEISGIWNAFLRGQLILGFVIGIVTFITLTIIRLPNALLLSILAGILEFIPNIGPILASIPAVLIALFQSDASWLGRLVGPIWFALIVLLLYAVIQRVENVVLVPRIIGRSLNLHPMVVFVGALAGASVAGIFGILLAAPILASARLILLYIYRKLLDRPPFEELLDA